MMLLVGRDCLVRAVTCGHSVRIHLRPGHQWHPGSVCIQFLEPRSAGPAWVCQITACAVPLARDVFVSMLILLLLLEARSATAPMNGPTMGC